MASETVVRDQLAFDRTLLANERTLLAYVRTALALVGAGAGLTLLFDSPAARIAGCALVVLGPVTAAFGFYRFLAVRADLHRARAGLPPI